VSGEKANSFDPDKAIAESRRRPISKEEMSGFGRPGRKKPNVVPMVTFEEVKTEDGRKIIPIIGVKGVF
jgi:hypothetical protein